MNKKRLLHFFGITYWIMGQQTEGLSHEDSVLQPKIRGNCMNWVLGHILESREKMLMLLNQETFMSDDERARYERGSDPVLDAENCVDFERLLSVLHESQQRITSALEALSEDDLLQVVNEEDETTLNDSLSFLHWHETYHTGQLEHLRQLAGTDDSIIR